MPIAINVGILIILTSDLVLSNLEIAYIAVAFLFVFLCTFSFYPDTPRQLYKNRKKEVTFNSIDRFKMYYSMNFFYRKLFDHFNCIVTSEVYNVKHMIAIKLKREEYINI